MSAEAVQANNTLIAVNAGPVQLRFLIMTAPSPSNLPIYIKELKKHGVKSLVRVCAPTYKQEVLASHGIKIYDGPGWFFEDGAPPPREVLSNWLNLLEQEFGIDDLSGKKMKGERQPDLVPQGPVSTPEASDSQPCVGVHCIAGLGRAPVLVAVALIELGGLSAADTVSHIRGSRHGCFNQDQLRVCPAV
eukprot:TRINITY_DN16354_c0_g1_i3.p2 TRINITY_DN16354_c0_g1~~TRINITY_DN16354_c0_g1_i3.p2  ORF type:complete len:190 (+),score=43.96 TRINITY_DN16354_c0_g1_i3:173-742(+)